MDPPAVRRDDRVARQRVAELHGDGRRRPCPALFVVGGPPRRASTRGPAPRSASAPGPAWAPEPAWASAVVAGAAAGGRVVLVAAGRAAGAGRRGGRRGLAGPQQLADARPTPPAATRSCGSGTRDRLASTCGHQLALALDLGVGRRLRRRRSSRGLLQVGPPLGHLLAGRLRLDRWPSGRRRSAARPGPPALDRVDPLVLDLVQVAGVEARHERLVGHHPLAVRARARSPAHRTTRSRTPRSPAGSPRRRDSSTFAACRSSRRASRRCTATSGRGRRRVEVLLDGGRVVVQRRQLAGQLGRGGARLLVGRREVGLHGQRLVVMLCELAALPIHLGLARGWIGGGGSGSPPPQRGRRRPAPAQPGPPGPSWARREPTPQPEVEVKAWGSGASLPQVAARCRRPCRCVRSAAHRCDEPTACRAKRVGADRSAAEPATKPRRRGSGRRRRRSRWRRRACPPRAPGCTTRLNCDELTWSAARSGIFGITRSFQR